MSSYFPLSYKVPEAVIEKSYEKSHILFQIWCASVFRASSSFFLPVCLFYFDVTSSFPPPVAVPLSAVPVTPSQAVNVKKLHCPISGQVSLKYSWITASADVYGG